MYSLRPYQSEAVRSCLGPLSAGHRVVLVAPTGAGKTTIGAEVCRSWIGGIVWLAHRAELVDQARSRVGDHVRVMSLQSALADPERVGGPSLVVCDEAHHLSEAGDWRYVLPERTPVLGLTATPQRGDGQALGDIFQRLVVASNYSALIADGHLAPCRVRAPVKLGAKVTAASVAATVAGLRSDGSLRCGFIFSASIDDAEAIAELVPRCASVTAATDDDTRAAAVQALRDGEIDWIANVATMTEGTDIPRANTAIIARPVGTTGLWLQMCGRVLRPYPGKQRGEIIDLCGSVWAHGSPVLDRDYSLRGDGISRPPSKRSVASVVVCLECGTAYSGVPACPHCGYRLARNSRGVTVDLSSLVVAYAGGATPGIGDQVEAWRAAGRDWRYVRRRCKELFGAAPPIPWAPEDDRRAEFTRLVAEAQRSGRALGWAAHRYRGIFGGWPA
jgi:hypothetical protein